MRTASSSTWWPPTPDGAISTPSGKSIARSCPTDFAMCARWSNRLRASWDCGSRPAKPIQTCSISRGPKPTGIASYGLRVRRAKKAGWGSLGYHLLIRATANKPYGRLNGWCARKDWRTSSTTAFWLRKTFRTTICSRAPIQWSRSPNTRLNCCARPSAPTRRWSPNRRISILSSATSARG